MRKIFVVCVAVYAAAIVAASATADLQDVTTGGSLRIRGNWYSDAFLDFSNHPTDNFFVEERAKINVTANFTSDVSAFIELDSYNIFGQDFRGLTEANANYSNGRSTSGFGGNLALPLGIDNGNGTPVALYQGYIEVKNPWGLPTTVRIGRQEIQWGSEFLVGNNDTSSRFRGLSFDGVTTSSEYKDFRLNSFYTELVHNNNPFKFEESADIWFTGTKLGYVGFKDMTLEAYYIGYRQQTTAATGALLPHPVDLHTIGLRFAGNRSRVDWDVEGAYQLGESGHAGPANDVNTFAATGVAGYTFDEKHSPRVFVKGAYYDGSDTKAAFNRLFSDHKYSEFVDATDMTNFWTIGGGAGANVTEKIELMAVANYLAAVATGGNPSSNIGVEVGLYATYHYSTDLYFKAGYAHLFTGKGVEAGLPVLLNGFGVLGGAGNKNDLNYAFLETGIKF